MLDGLDLDIIKELQADTRQSFRSIGRKLKISEGTIRNRVKKELSNNTIKITVIPRFSNLGYEFTCVTGLKIKISKIARAEEILKKSPNVYFLTGCTGNYDLIMVLVFRNASEFDRFVKGTVSNLPGILGSETFVCMNISKSPWMNDVDMEGLVDV